jgi:aminoglycoside phosphotransferase (APT) family kinase protein
MADDPNDIAALSAIVGAPVLAAEPCGWGFENRTAIVTLADGRQLVVQRINSRALAQHKLKLARLLPDRLAAVGLRAPRLLAADASSDPPYAVREYLPGEPGASLMGTVTGAVQVALAMGALLPRLAKVSGAGVGLHSGWAQPARLARQSKQQLERCRPLLDNAAIATLETTIAEVPARFADRPACFAHGDFCPVNVLIDGQRTIDDRQGERENTTIAVVGLLDLEFARIADPLFDAAWWGWVVRYHHPERWLHAWPHLLAAAGIAQDQATHERVRVLQRLRCLEVVDYYAHARPPEATAVWVGRLVQTLGWE